MVPSTQKKLFDQPFSPAEYGIAALEVPLDYKIHHSSPKHPQLDRGLPRTGLGASKDAASQSSDFDPTLASHPWPSSIDTPHWWEDKFRRVPAYRPVNYDLDRKERQQSPLFTLVGKVMIFGCSAIAVSP
jgi:hypothetical protein